MDEYINEQGVCPNCGEDLTDYGVVEFADDSCYFPYTCVNCGQTGKEWYQLEFSGHQIYKEGGESVVL